MPSIEDSCRCFNTAEGHSKISSAIPTGEISPVIHLRTCPESISFLNHSVLVHSPATGLIVPARTVLLSGNAIRGLYLIEIAGKAGIGPISATSAWCGAVPATCRSAPHRFRWVCMGTSPIASPDYSRRQTTVRMGGAGCRARCGKRRALELHGYVEKSPCENYVHRPYL